VTVGSSQILAAQNILGQLSTGRAMPQARIGNPTAAQGEAGSSTSRVTTPYQSVLNNNRPGRKLQQISSSNRRNANYNNTN